MNHFRLSHLAEQDLEDIWVYLTQQDELFFIDQNNRFVYQYNGILVSAGKLIRLSYENL